MSSSEDDVPLGLRAPAADAHLQVRHRTCCQAAGEAGQGGGGVQWAERCGSAPDCSRSPLHSRAAGARGAPGSARWGRRRGCAAVGQRWGAARQSATHTESEGGWGAAAGGWEGGAATARCIRGPAARRLLGRAAAVADLAAASTPSPQRQAPWVKPCQARSRSQTRWRLGRAWPPSAAARGA